jgi:hypothetical protein
MKGVRGGIGLVVSVSVHLRPLSIHQTPTPYLWGIGLCAEAWRPCSDSADRRHDINTLLSASPPC